MADEIPSKQRQYAGTLEELDANLLDREIGFCVGDNHCYIKMNGHLYMLGLDTLPEVNSILTGNADGTYEWKAPSTLVYTFALNESKMYDASGNAVSGSTLASVVTDGIVPMVLERTSHTGSIVAVATLAAFSSSGIAFRTPISAAGEFVEITGSIYTSAWTFETKTLAS